MRCLEEQAEVTHVTETNRAKERIAANNWHLVITDINSPEVNDLDITQMVKAVDPHTSIIIITSNVKVDFILTAMQHHADGLFFKPIDEVEFTSRAIQLAEEAKNNKEKKKKIVLAIGAHPDDVEFGCAGTLAKLRAEGARINILTLSLGAVGGDPAIRKREAEEAAKMQEAQLFLGNMKDTKISDTSETIEFIEEIINQVNPTHVYTHAYNDSHQDHRCIHRATLTASRQISKLFGYLSPSSTVDFRPNIFINIDHFIDDKLKILSLFRSQIDKRPYLRPEIIEATARYWGRFCNYHLVEPMEVIKEHY